MLFAVLPDIAYLSYSRDHAQSKLCLALLGPVDADENGGSQSTAVTASSRVSSFGMGGVGECL